MRSFEVPFLNHAVKVTHSSSGVTEISFLKKKLAKTSACDAHEKQMAFELEKYLSGAKATLDLPIDWKGLKATDFQKKVWRKMAKIPYGKVKTYGEIAQSIGSPKAARAVGTACGKNPVLLAIPCHRVVGTSGLGGFSGGGLPVKRKLHQIEGITLS